MTDLATENERCGTCKFFDPEDSKPTQAGACHRYPTPVRKSPASWCGEFVPSGK